MKILIANPGSTSYKCKLYDMADMKVLFQASVERIGDKEEGLFSISLMIMKRHHSKRKFRTIIPQLN